MKKTLNTLLAILTLSIMFGSCGKNSPHHRWDCYYIDSAGNPTDNYKSFKFIGTEKEMRIYELANNCDCNYL